MFSHRKSYLLGLAVVLVALSACQLKWPPPAGEAPAEGEPPDTSSVSSAGWACQGPLLLPHAHLVGGAVTCGATEPSGSQAQSSRVKRSGRQEPV